VVGVRSALQAAFGLDTSRNIYNQACCARGSSHASQVDGSGLSRWNKVSADTIATLLTAISQQGHPLP
jgi:D-alanyl-D-alanine carboxypeptidase